MRAATNRNIRFPPAMLNEIDELAEKLLLTRNKLVVRLCQIGLNSDEFKNESRAQIVAAINHQMPRRLSGWEQQIEQRLEALEKAAGIAPAVKAEASELLLNMLNK
ncbi:hypothetical protein EAN04_24610 [Salmonella enterica]|nr:hypothetical protein [Salmonella enterica]